MALLLTRAEAATLHALARELAARSYSPSMREVARAAEVSRASALNAIVRLESEGLVETAKNDGGRRVQRTMKLTERGVRVVRGLEPHQVVRARPRSGARAEPGGACAPQPALFPEPLPESPA